MNALSLGSTDDKEYMVKLRKDHSLRLECDGDSVREDFNIMLPYQQVVRLFEYLQKELT